MLKNRHLDTGQQLSPVSDPHHYLELRMTVECPSTGDTFLRPTLHENGT